MASQASLIIRKNVILKKRNSHTTCAECFFPLLLLGLLVSFFWMFVSTARGTLDDDAADYNVTGIPALSAKNDRAILYAPSDHGGVTSLILSLREKYPSVPFRGYVDVEALVEANDDDPLHTKAAVVFHLTEQQVIVDRANPNAPAGLSWDNVGVSDDGGLSYESCLGMLCFDCLLYLILAWYFDQVIPGEYGTAKRAYFPIMPSYWRSAWNRFSCLSSQSARDSNSDPERMMGNKVVIKNLVKTFSNGVMAVDQLSLEARENEILSLLGHNGAGKTTTLQVLTGLLEFDGGEVEIFGLDLSSQLEDVRRFTGICPQQNVIWDQLTVREHMEFYSALKGDSLVPGETYHDLINGIGLRTKMDTLAGALSGGQKRKLCVAMALQGNSRLVFLDEPTSGMDPVSRRELWNVVQSHKEGRTIILTTHFMEEAEELGDSIAIMGKGRLLCCDTSLSLKSTYGAGYVLTLVTNEQSNREELKQLVTSMCKGSTVGSDAAAELSFRLPWQSSPSFPKLFNALDEKEGSYRSYGISLTTMEDVFIKVTEESTPKDGNRDDCQSRHVEEALQIEMGPKSSPRQLMAFEVKHALVAVKDVPQLVCQVVLPVGLLIVTFVILSVMNTPVDYLPTLQMSPYELPHNASVPYSSPDGSADVFMRQWSPQEAVLTSDVHSYILDHINSTLVGGSMFIPISQQEVNITALYNPVYVHSIPIMMNTLNNLFLDNCLANVYAHDSYKAVLYNDPLPPGPLDVAINNMNGHVIGGLVMSVGFAIATSASSAYIVKERVSGVKNFLLVNGASKWIYWTSFLVWDVLMSVFPIITLVIGFCEGYIGQHVDDLGASVLLAVLYVMASSLQSYCMSFKVDRYDIAQGVLASINVIIFFFFISPIISVSLTTGTTSIATKILTIALSVLSPSFCVCVGLLKTINFAGFRSAVPPGTSLLDFSLLGVHLAALSFHILLFTIILIIIESEITFGRKHVETTGEPPSDEVLDVERERMRVTAGTTDAVVADRLRKVYVAQRGTKVAVADLSLGIPRGECFGLLGHNGAGKTTTISMLSGDVRPTSGTATIGGFDIQSAKEGARSVMGVCPQFDMLFPSMTGRQHLSLYAQVKGIPPHQVDRVVDAFVNMMDLTTYADRAAGNYSGGNKRKLSLAIALLGNPDVVYLDEPSTGMDPVARRFLWNTINTVKHGRAIILTTHSMEECDYLCDRLAIMKQGAMACLGTSQHIKTLFGTTLRLDIKLDPSSRVSALPSPSDSPSQLHPASASEHTMAEQHPLVAWVIRKFKGSKLIEAREDKLTYSFTLSTVPSDENGHETRPAPQKLKLSTIFSKLERHRRKLGIEHMSISQPTLEQIFLSVTHEEELQDDRELVDSQEGRWTWAQLAKAYGFLLLAVFFPGAHHLHLRNWGKAVIYFLTWNLIGVGWVYDLVFMASLVGERARAQVTG